jgi:hypothetical protein
MAGAKAEPGSIASAAEARVGWELRVTHEMLAVFLAVVAILIIATFAWTVYLTRDVGRMVKAVAGMVYQEAKKTRASLPSRER